MRRVLPLLASAAWSLSACGGAATPAPPADAGALAPDAAAARDAAVSGDGGFFDADLSPLAVDPARAAHTVQSADLPAPGDVLALTPLGEAVVAGRAFAARVFIGFGLEPKITVLTASVALPAEAPKAVAAGFGGASAILWPNALFFGDATEELRTNRFGAYLHPEEYALVLGVSDDAEFWLGGSKLARTASESVDELSIPSAAGPITAMAAGAAGKVWVAHGETLYSVSLGAGGPSIRAVGGLGIGAIRALAAPSDHQLLAAGDRGYAERLESSGNVRWQRWRMNEGGFDAIASAGGTSWALFKGALWAKTDAGFFPVLGTDQQPITGAGALAADGQGAALILRHGRLERYTLGNTASISGVEEGDVISMVTRVLIYASDPARIDRIDALVGATAVTVHTSSSAGASHELTLDPTQLPEGEGSLSITVRYQGGETVARSIRIAIGRALPPVGWMNDIWPWAIGASAQGTCGCHSMSYASPTAAPKFGDSADGWRQSSQMILQRVVFGIGSPMPPPGNPSPNSDQKELLRRWIEGSQHD